MKFILGASLFGAVVVAISNKTPTHADKSASVEQSKPALKPDDKVPPYTVISEETDPATKLWRNVHVRLQEKVSEDDLRRIAQKIKSEKPKISAGQIYYHLPEQTVKLDAKGRVDGFEDWASAVFTPKEVFKFDPNPKLEVTFSGNPKGTLPPKPNGEIVGQWEWNKVGSFETLLRTKEGLKMVTTSGETGKAILNELVTVKKEGNRIIIRPIKKAGHNDGYFWVLDEEKNLLVMDPESNDRMGKAIAIIKPTLKL